MEFKKKKHTYWYTNVPKLRKLKKRQRQIEPFLNPLDLSDVSYLIKSPEKVFVRTNLEGDWANFCHSHSNEPIRFNISHPSPAPLATMHWNV